jgi:ANTAR domain
MDSQTAGDDPHGVGMQVLNGGDGDGGQLDKTVEARLADCEKLVENLHVSRASRSTIDQAIGILMAPGGHTADEAIEVLIQASQRENRKLRDIAADLVTERSRTDAKEV